MMPYLPGPFDHPPCNSVEKINSGYKAWEYLMYIFGLGPGLFYGILPQKYWRNFCKIVFTVHILHQHKILANPLHNAHVALLDFIMEFEQIFFQQLVRCIHFMCPC